MNHIACAIVFAVITWDVNIHCRKEGGKCEPHWADLLIVGMWFVAFLGAVC